MELRELYRHLVNVEQHPDVLMPAFDLVAQRTRTVSPDGGLTAELSRFVGRSVDALSELLDVLAGVRARYARPWSHATGDLGRRQALHYFTQYMPTALVDGCWLQGGVGPTADTRVGESIAGLYAHQVRAYADTGRDFGAEYRAVHARLGAPVEERDSFALPVFLLSLGQFIPEFPGEILGVNLVWQFLNLSAFGPVLIRDVCAAHSLPLPGADPGEAHFGKARTLARTAAEQFLAEVDATDRGHAWSRLLGGAIAGATAWHDWFVRTGATAPARP